MVRADPTAVATAAAQHGPRACAERRCELRPGWPRTGQAREASPCVGVAPVPQPWRSCAPPEPQPSEHTGTRALGRTSLFVSAQPQTPPFAMWTAMSARSKAVAANTGAITTVRASWRPCATRSCNTGGGGDECGSPMGAQAHSSRARWRNVKALRGCPGYTCIGVRTGASRLGRSLRAVLFACSRRACVAAQAPIAFRITGARQHRAMGASGRRFCHSCCFLAPKTHFSKRRAWLTKADERGLSARKW